MGSPTSQAISTVTPAEDKLESWYEKVNPMNIPVLATL
jgi:hypothetical protein